MEVYFRVDIRFNPSPKISLSRRQNWDPKCNRCGKICTTVLTSPKLTFGAYITLRCKKNIVGGFIAVYLHSLHVKRQHLFLSTPILSFTMFQGTAFQQISQPNFLSVPMYLLDMGGYSQGLGNLPVLGNMYT